MARLYSLYRLYGNRWVRVAREQLPLREAHEKWSHLVSQNPLFYSILPKYSIRLIPKSEIRRQILQSIQNKEQS